MVVIAVAGYGLDQWTKAKAVAHLDPDDPPSWFGGFFTLRLLRNPGAAFSMGSTATVLISLFAIAMLINIVLMLFGIHLGLASFGPIGILCSAVGVVLATMNLVMDFDYAEQGVRNQAPVSESWRAAFGIAVTMVWLYTEILRILSYFRSE